ncbi:hypothetical protein TNCV_4527481 [Trichonephila clavipes]|nr:hypothetical protein TNCV_4527481 [Trichonephila clavipes]
MPRRFPTVMIAAISFLAWGPESRAVSIVPSGFGREVLERSLQTRDLRAGKSDDRAGQFTSSRRETSHSGTAALRTPMETLEV